MQRGCVTHSLHCLPAMAKSDEKKKRRRDNDAAEPPNADAKRKKKDKKKKRRSVVMTSDTGNVARHDVVMRGSSFDLDQAFPARPSAIDMVRPGANSELV